MAILGIDDFKSKLTGGGARPSLFKATVNFPSYVSSANVELTSFYVSKLLFQLQPLVVSNLVLEAERLR